MISDFHPEAETEFHAAIDYYEGCEKELGYDFARGCPIVLDINN